MIVLMGILTVVAAVGSALAAFFANSTARKVAEVDRTRLTLEMMTRFREVEEVTFGSLTTDEIMILHRLDWSRRPRHEAMQKMIDYVNAGELLADAWRSSALDSPLLLRHHTNVGLNFPMWRDYLFPAMRSGSEQVHLFDAFESLMGSFWLQLPESARVLERSKVPLYLETANLLVGAASFTPALQTLAPFIHHES